MSTMESELISLAWSYSELLPQIYMITFFKGLTTMHVSICEYDAGALILAAMLSLSTHTKVSSMPPRPFVFVKK